MPQPGTGARRGLLAAVAFAVLLNPLNSSMISVALPHIEKDFGVPFSRLTWLIATYYLASAIAQPVMGRVSDLFGRRRLFYAGLVLVTVASALAPWAPSLVLLIAFRTIQAVGSSTLYPAGMAMVRDAFTTGQAQALGILAVFSSTSAALGPSLGGFLVHLGGWPAIFTVNFPLIAVSLFLALRSLPADAPRAGAPSRLDLPGAALFSMTVVTALYFLFSLDGRGPAWWAAAAAIVLGWAFTRLEMRVDEPFMDVRVFRRDAPRTFVYLAWTLSNVAFYSIFFGMPTYLETARHLSPGATGLVMLALAAPSSLISPVVGRWVDRAGHRPALVGSGATFLLGAAGLAAVGGSAPLWALGAILALLGASNGMNNLALQAALYRFVPLEETGAASGIFMTARYTGTILSSSLLGIVFGRAVSAGGLRELSWRLALGLPMSPCPRSGRAPSLTTAQPHLRGRSRETQLHALPRLRSRRRRVSVRRTPPPLWRRGRPRPAAPSLSLT
ncbi:MAG: MFS transporter [Firmicutes bacterium]|nr:MFS transporter [Bacillota bacterium]